MTNDIQIPKRLESGRLILEKYSDNIVDSFLDQIIDEESRIIRYQVHLKNLKTIEDVKTFSVRSMKNGSPIRALGMP